MSIERRSTTSPLKVEAREDGPSRIEGFAARYYDGTPGTEYGLWENTVERIMPGAFDEASRSDGVMALFNHDPSKILGSTRSGSLKLEASGDGLFYSVTPPDTPTGQEVLANVRSGDITGSSFGFRVTDEEWRSDGSLNIRQIKGVELLDVSPVTYPAYGSTSAGVRADGITDEARSSFDKWNGERRMRATEWARQRVRAIQASLTEAE
jgi:HK97 family phage prohead protease